MQRFRIRLQRFGLFSVVLAGAIALVAGTARAQPFPLGRVIGSNDLIDPITGFGEGMMIWDLDCNMAVCSALNLVPPFFSYPNTVGFDGTNVYHVVGDNTFHNIGNPLDVFLVAQPGSTLPPLPCAQIPPNCTHTPPLPAFTLDGTPGGLTVHIEDLAFSSPCNLWGADIVNNRLIRWDSCAAVDPRPVAQALPITGHFKDLMPVFRPTGIASTPLGMYASMGGIAEHAPPEIGVIDLATGVYTFRWQEPILPPYSFFYIHSLAYDSTRAVLWENLSFAEGLGAQVLRQRFLNGASAGPDIVLNSAPVERRFDGFEHLSLPVAQCGICDGSTLLVDRNVTVDFNSGTPCTDGYGGAGLCAFFTGVTTGTPDKWKAIFDVGGKELVVAKGVTITTTPVPASGNNRAAPGIDIKGTCRLQVDASDATTAAGAIVVSSLNQPAGPINLSFDGGVTINGTVLDEVRGTNGTPGSININALCGFIVTGPMSHIVTIGQDHGGSDISLTSCTGDIIISGLVDASYKAAPASTININAPGGAVLIDGNNLIEIEPGTGRRVTSGVTVRSRRDPVAGFINIQASKDVTVLGNQVLTTNPATQNYGAVAIKPGGTNGTSGAGAMKVVSLNARIVASDRAFDFANRFNLLNSITLFAKGDINLTVTAGPQAVVSTRGGSAGNGGTNTLRSYSGGINIAAGAQVLADFTGTPGSGGMNLLTACTGVFPVFPTPGVTPQDATGPGDDSGTCTPGPNPILPLCVPQGACQSASSLSVLVTRPNVISYVPMGHWGGGSTNVAVVNIEGSSIVPQQITTPNIVNSCASNSVTLQTICTANNTDVYVISGTSLNSTLQSDASGTILFSGGVCTNCGVAMDVIHNKAVIGLSFSSGVGGYQFLDLSSLSKEPIFASQAPPGFFANISEDILIDPFRNLVLSPSENNNYELVDVRTTMNPAFFENPVSLPVVGVLDSAGEDCSTGLALAPVENLPIIESHVYIADLNHATYTPGSPGTWTAPSLVKQLTESFLAAGSSGIAVAQGTHTGVVTGEFGGDAITAIELPATSTPNIIDWVTCRIPNIPPPFPGGVRFSMGYDPHTVTAYKGGKFDDAMALIANFAFFADRPTFLAVVDLTKMLDRSIVPRTPGDHACSAPGSFLPFPSGVVRFVTVP